MTLHDALLLALEAADAGLSQVPRDRESATEEAVARVRRAVANGYRLWPDPARLIEAIRGVGPAEKESS